MMKQIYQQRICKLVMSQIQGLQEQEVLNHYDAISQDVRFVTASKSWTSKWNKEYYLT